MATKEFPLIPEKVPHVQTKYRTIRTEIPVTMDFSVFKTFVVNERAKLQLRASAYNLANTPQFVATAPVQPSVSFGAANFGVVALAQVNDARIVEVALKLNF